MRLCWHSIEDRAPDVRFHKVSIVLIKPFSWAAVMVHDLKSLTYLKVIVKSSFVFVLKRGEDARIVPIYGCVTLLFVGRYS